MIWEGNSPIGLFKLPANETGKVWETLDKGKEYLFKTPNKNEVSEIIQTRWSKDNIIPKDLVYYKDNWVSVAKTEGDTITLIVDEKNIEVDKKYCRKRVPVEILICDKTPKILHRMELGPCDDMNIIAKELCKENGMKLAKSLWYSNGKELVTKGKECKFNPKENDKAICIIVNQDLRTFQRFKKVSSGNWYMSNSSPDSIRFIALKQVMVYGFGMYYVKEGPTSYTMTYEIFINEDPVQKSTIVVSKPDSDAKIFKIYFNSSMSPFTLSKDQKISICIKYNEYDNASRLYSGQSGEENPKIEENEEGVFRVENHSNSGNGTGVSAGQIPEIYYST